MNFKRASPLPRGIIWIIMTMKEFVVRQPISETYQNMRTKELHHDL